MNIHLIAIGGSAMHNLALALQKNGHRVTGSDDEIFDPARTRLARAGLLPDTLGWHTARITPQLDLVILGMHAHADNPELAEAQRLGLRVLSYPEYLYHHAQDKRRIVVGGSHGKTTTTAMILHVLRYWQLEVDFMVGAQLAGFDTMVSLSDAPIMVLEGDEYLSSALQRVPKFHFYKPHIAILTGIAWDHINVFPTWENYKEQFVRFVETMEDNALLIYYGGDVELVRIAEQAGGHIRKALYDTPVHRVLGGVTYLKNADGVEVPLGVFGKHNLQNLTAARLACAEVGISDGQFLEAIGSFKGAAKRMQLVAKGDDTAVYSDFAHAPSKVRASIEALKQQYPNRKLVAALELHTYSSLNIRFLDEYRQAMNDADYAVVYYDEHTLQLKRLPFFEPSAVQNAFDHPNLVVVCDREAVEQQLLVWRHTGVNFLLMSSGNFGGLSMDLFAQQLI
jgi:UDP-N-acetylmuramate: L-alanyl-gamma-D-glutamyl-meso-diaminopimelate ligase